MLKIHEREGSEEASTASTEVTSGGLGGCTHDILLSCRAGYMIVTHTVVCFCLQSLQRVLQLGCS